MKKIILILIVIFFSSISVKAADNYLNSVVLEGTDDGYNLVLRSDNAAKVKKTISSENKIVLEVKGITPAPSMNTIYRNTSDVSGLIVENSGNNTVKIYVSAKDIAKANIIFDTPATPPIIVADEVSTDTIMWSVAVFGLLCIIISTTKSLKSDEYMPISNLKRDIKEREFELYRNYKKELAKMPNINYKINRKYQTNTITYPKTIRTLEKVAKS